MRSSGPTARRSLFAEYSPFCAASAIEGAATSCDGITLSELGRAALMDRIDTKFLLPASAVPELLRSCAPGYRVLEVAGRRLSRYHTVYFDTDDLALYRAHHDGRFPRRKIRVRTYLDTGQQYLEVKVKANTGRAVKSRIPFDPSASLRDQLAGSPLLDAAGIAPERLHETVTVCYSRLTLVATTAAQRVTLDVDLQLSLGGETRSYPHLVIAEVKQEGRAHSDFLGAVRALGFRQHSVSKYCLGVASLDPQAKKNLYKQLLSRIAKTDTSNLHSNVH